MSETTALILLGLGIFVFTSLMWGGFLLFRMVVNRDKLKKQVMLQTMSNRTVFRKVTKAVYYAGQGSFWHYQYRGKEQMVGIPDKYVFHMIRGKVTCGQNETDVCAVPIMGDAPVTIGEQYKILLRTHGISEAYKEMNSKPNMGVILAVAGSVLLLLVMVVVIVMVTKNHKAADTGIKVITSTGVLGQ